MRNEQLAEHERRAARKRAVAIQRAKAAIELALADLSELDRTLVLFTALKEDNGQARIRAEASQLQL
jgi:hypothetical protein